MKHISRVTWGLLLGLGLAVPGNAQAQALPFKSTNGYQFSIPAGWHMAYLNGPDVVLLAPPPLQGTNITVVANDAPPGATLDAVREAVNRSKLHPAKGFHQLSQALTTVGAERALDSQVTYELDPPLGKNWARQVIFVKNGREYELTCTAAMADKGAGNGLFDALLKTLQWTTPAAPITDEEFKHIDTSNAAYAYVVPAGWTPRPLSADGQGQNVLLTPVDLRGGSNIRFSSIAAPAGRTVENEAVTIDAQYPRNLAHYVLQAQWFTSIDGAPALETCYTWGEGKKIVRGAQVFSLKEARQYTLTGTFPAAGYEKDQAAFDRLLLSVRWADQ